MQLALDRAMDLSANERQDLDIKIDQMIINHSKSRVEITKLSAECVALATATEARANALASQGAVSRVLGAITGSNQRLQASNMRDLAAAQYAAQQTIVRLAEQNAMTMEVAVIIGNRVNCLVKSLTEVQGEVGGFWKTIGSLATATKAKIAEISLRVEVLERSQNLLFWKETIEDRMFDGVYYAELNNVQKIVCLASDFFEVS